MLEAPSRATLDLLLTTMFWRAPAAREPEDVRNADELLAALASVTDNEVDTAERISTWLQEERGLPAATAEHIADRFILVSRSID
jgi:hypothetical protein